MPFKGTCRDCGTIILGQDKQQFSKMLLEHHNQAREAGSWTSAACGIFSVQEINDGGKEIDDFWLEATMTAVVRPWTGTLWHDIREGRRGKEG